MIKYLRKTFMTLLFILPTIIFAQVDTEIFITKIDSTENSLLIIGLDVKTNKSVIIAGEINNTNREIINSYEYMERRIFSVTNITIPYASTIELGPLIFEGKEMEKRADKYDVYTTVNF